MPTYAVPSPRSPKRPAPSATGHPPDIGTASCPSQVELEVEHLPNSVASSEKTGGRSIVERPVGRTTLTAARTAVTSGRRWARSTAE
jgi:hypothetical protein